MHQLLPFLGISLIVIMSPGPDTLLTLRNTLLGGRRAGFASACGVATGQLCWALAAGVGVAALLVSSRPLFLTLKYLGAAYLVFIGARALFAAWRGRLEPAASDGAAPGGAASDGAAPGGAASAGPAPRIGRAYRQAVLSNLANPKMAAFFTSLLPQFAPAQGPALGTLLGLGALFAVLTAGWLALYTLAASAARRLLTRERVRRWLEAATGAVLVALGVRVATT